MTFLQFMEGLSLVLALLTPLLFCYQFLYLFLPLFGKRKLPEAKTMRKYAILIAARNEEAVLPHLLDSIRAQNYPQELITMFVVADNCTDNTAKVAAEHGAVVYERFNKEKVGKGYALNFLLNNVKSDYGYDAFDAYLIFDADNLLHKDYIKRMNGMPEAGYEAFCGYRNTKNFGNNWITSGYGLWYLHESTHLNRSRMFLGTGCAVNGTGFGFTRELLKRIGSWDFFTLTEDLEFNNWCASNQVKIGYCHDAVLYDEQPLTFPQSWKQRIRWTQGGIQVSLKYVGKIIPGIFRRNWSGYTCYEQLTLSMWGFAWGTLVGMLSFGLILSKFQWLPLTLIGAMTLVGSYMGMFWVGLLTMLTERKRIHATTAQKVRSVFTFPLFMMTFVLTTVAAFFKKCEWTPIEHTVAISAEELV